MEYSLIEIYVTVNTNVSLKLMFANLEHYKIPINVRNKTGSSTIIF